MNDEDLAHLLEQTSRTFALAIPLLEQPLRRQVGLAYLLFRIADTLEDAPKWGRAERAAGLASFVRWIHRDGPLLAKGPTDDAGCIELLARADHVLAAVDALGHDVRAAILSHSGRTALGMAEFVARQDELGRIVLEDLEDLRHYAYVVAGIVGEMLTDLFVLELPGLTELRARLDEDAAAFGEGLQLVNILKDAPADATEGRAYLPPSIQRAAVFDLAKNDLVAAARFVTVLRNARAPEGVVAFCDLPVKLAEATLAKDAKKISREEALAIFASVTAHCSKQ